MTAREMVETAFKHLGYTDRLGKPDANAFSPHYKMALTACNAVMNELQRKEGREYTTLATLDDTIELSERSINEIMPYGVAMHLAIIDNDESQQSVFSSMYSQKLGLVPKAQKTVTLSYKPME